MTIVKTEHFDIQRKIVANMTSQSWQDIPHVSYMYEADISDFLTVFKMLNAQRKNEDRISLNTLSLKILTEGLKSAPQMNAHINYNKNLVRGEINTIKEIDISMPMILPNGKMMTVNLKDFGNKSLDQMTSYIEDIRRRALNTNLNEAMYEVSLRDTINALLKGDVKKAIFRLIGSKTGKHKIKTLKGRERREYIKIAKSDRLTYKDLEQGTVTISNIGSVCKSENGVAALLEIIPPQICAFAVGTISEKPVVRKYDGKPSSIEVGRVLPICICFDHRALDFADIIPFINKLDEIFQKPEILIEWMDEKEINSKAS